MAVQSRVVIGRALSRTADLARDGRGRAVGDRDHAQRRPGNGTVIQHACRLGPLALPVSPVPVAVVEATFGRALVSAPRSLQRRLPGRRATIQAAVPRQPPRTPKAQEEARSTPSAQEPAAALQGSPPWPACQNWTTRSARAKMRSGPFTGPPRSLRATYSEPPHLTPGRVIANPRSPAGQVSTRLVPETALFGERSHPDLGQLFGQSVERALRRGHVAHPRQEFPGCPRRHLCHEPDRLLRSQRRPGRPNDAQPLLHGTVVQPTPGRTRTPRPRHTGTAGPSSEAGLAPSSAPTQHALRLDHRCQPNLARVPTSLRSRLPWLHPVPRARRGKPASLLGCSPPLQQRHPFRARRPPPGTAAPAAAPTIDGCTLPKHSEPHDLDRSALKQGARLV